MSKKEVEVVGVNGDTPNMGENGVAAVAKIPGVYSAAELMDMRKRMTVVEMAKLCGMTRQGMAAKLKRYDARFAGVEEFRADKSLILNVKQRAILDELDAKKIRRMSGAQLILGAAILEDKISKIENPIRGGFPGGLWINIVTASKKQRDLTVDVTPKAEEV